MKVVLATVLFLSLSVTAAPKVGDRVELSIDYTAGSFSKTGTGSIEITEIKNGKAHLVIELNFEGEDRQLLEEDQNVKDLGYIENIEQLKKMCEKNGGELGTATVDGKMIDICTSEKENGYIKNAVVPFGTYEAFEDSDGTTSHLKLLKYSFGQ